MMSLAHIYSRTIDSPLDPAEASKRVSDLAYIESKKPGLAVRARLLHGPHRWTGKMHGDAFYLFKMVGPNLIPPRFGVDLRVHIAPAASGSSVNLRVRPNRWLYLAALWWTAVAIAMTVAMFTTVQPTLVTAGITGSFAVIAATQHVTIARACREELDFVKTLLGP